MSSPVNVQIVLLRPRIPVLLGSLIALNSPVPNAGSVKDEAERRRA
jgi:hypothetical protein